MLCCEFYFCLNWYLTCIRGARALKMDFRTTCKPGEQVLVGWFKWELGDLKQIYALNYCMAAISCHLFTFVLNLNYISQVFKLENIPRNNQRKSILTSNEKWRGFDQYCNFREISAILDVEQKKFFWGVFLGAKRSEIEKCDRSKDSLWDILGPRWQPWYPSQTNRSIAGGRTFAIFKVFKTWKRLEMQKHRKFVSQEKSRRKTQAPSMPLLSFSFSLETILKFLICI